MTFKRLGCRSIFIQFLQHTKKCEHLPINNPKEKNNDVEDSGVLRIVQACKQRTPKSSVYELLVVMVVVGEGQGVGLQAKQRFVSCFPAAA